MAVLASWIAGRANRTVQLLAAVALTLNVYSVWVGGDSWEFVSNRYHAVATPLATLALLVALHGRWAANRMAVVLVLAWSAAAQLRLFLPGRLAPEDSTLFVVVLVVLAVAVFAWRTGAAVSGWWCWWALQSRVGARRRPRLCVRRRRGSGARRACARGGAGHRRLRRDRRGLGRHHRVHGRPAGGRPARQVRRAHRGPGAERVQFFPGHDKWDLQISVVDERPDLVLELVGNLDEAEALLARGLRAPLPGRATPTCRCGCAPTAPQWITGDWRPARPGSVPLDPGW